MVAGKIASDLECDVEEFAENKAEFLRAFESTSAARDDLGRVAIDNLGEKLGYLSVTATEIGTFELPDDVPLEPKV